MNQLERRRHPRHKTEVDAKIFVKNQEIPARMVDISEGGICINSEKPILPGTEVFIALKLDGSYAIQGIVVWTSYVYERADAHYRMGIEADCMILKDIKAMGFPERTELLARLLSEIRTQGSKSVKKT